jgi:hypothetical protein
MEQEHAEGAEKRTQRKRKDDWRQIPGDSNLSASFLCDLCGLLFNLFSFASPTGGSM